MAKKQEHLRRSDQEAELAESNHSSRSGEGTRRWAAIQAYYSVLHRLHALADAKWGEHPGSHAEVAEVLRRVDPQRPGQTVNVGVLRSISFDARYTAGEKWFGPSFLSEDDTIDRALSLMRQLNRIIDGYF